MKRFEDKFKAKILEVIPESPSNRSKAYRVISYSEESVLVSELYEAMFEICDVGGIEYGPEVYLDLGMWKQVATIVGDRIETKEDVIEVFDEIGRE